MFQEEKTTEEVIENNENVSLENNDSNEIYKRCFFIIIKMMN